MTHVTEQVFGSVCRHAIFKSSHEGSPDAAENQRGEHIGHAEPIPESQVDAHAEDEQGADKGETVDNGAAEQGCEKAGKEGDAPLKDPYGKGRKDGPRRRWRRIP